MNQVNGFVLLSSVLQPALAAYSLHLNRVFGSRHVGWWVFWAFVCLALLHVAHLLQPTGPSPGLLDVWISLLLLVGMVHTQSVCRGRANFDRQGHKLSADLERVSRQADELKAANKNLIQQLLARKQREDTLETSAQQLGLLFFENPQPMWVFGLTSLRLLTANQAALRLYGYSGSELMSCTARELHADEEIAGFQEDCAKASSPAPAPRLWRHRRKDGSVLEVEVMSVDLPFDGSPARLLVVHEVSRGRKDPPQVSETGDSLNAQLLNLDAVIEDAIKTLGG